MLFRLAIWSLLFVFAPTLGVSQINSGASGSMKQAMKAAGASVGLGVVLWLAGNKLDTWGESNIETGNKELVTAQGDPALPNLSPGYFE